MSPKKAELYEIIANRMRETEDSPLPVNRDTFEIPLMARPGARREREVVFSLDAAFVIFVIFLLLLGTAYFLGLQKGEQKARTSFSTAAAIAVPQVKLESIETATSQAVAPVAAITIPEGRYTLRLTESAKREEIEKLKKELLANDTIRNYKVEVFIFAAPSAQGGESYILALGSFSSPNDETLVRFQRFFKDQGNEKFAYTFPELVDDLKRSGRIIE